MLFLASHGFRSLPTTDVVMAVPRSHGMAMIWTLRGRVVAAYRARVKECNTVGHSTGGGEVTRYLDGTERRACAKVMLFLPYLH